ncbi:DUF2332 domain-containing protein [Streptomyces rubradiris]|uniref:DUF2332 domain-containing protein n=1 Tax=Streptomyces rubradiris TaxID=285531 RepID=A0ABQ3RAC7_STRRR|nr:DUF2332 domain-containing protein [Streptomyces rubradiris]GHH26030.1 hypothetical protein GCM10018792_65960 [Streptomyces rubradiris]GHI52801.1 hypothetical protein Srubr_26470 [Streptomyces rubradiris]
MTDHTQLAETFRRFADQQAASLSPLYATLARAVARTPELLDLAAHTRPGQPAPNMLLAAVHHVLRRGVKHPLAAYFTGHEDLADDHGAGLLTDFCRHHAGRIRQIISTRSVQTNEVNRCTVLLPAFAALQQQLSDGRPIRIVDVGASAGLALLWDRYTYDYDGHRLTLPDSDPDTVLHCAVKGAAPPLTLDVTRFVRPVGIEPSPVDVTDPEATEWLVSLTWPEQTQRMHTLNCALAVAARTPPTILAGTAQDHLADIVAQTPDDQHLVLVFSWSIYQIFGSPGGRERLVDTLAELSRRRPLHEISIGHFSNATPRMIMASHDSGVSRSEVVAHCDIYGTWIDWLAKTPAPAGT